MELLCNAGYCCFCRSLVSASQDGKLIVWDGYTTNKVCINLQSHAVLDVHVYWRLLSFIAETVYEFDLVLHYSKRCNRNCWNAKILGLTLGFAPYLRLRCWLRYNTFRRRYVFWRFSLNEKTIVVIVDVITIGLIHGRCYCQVRINLL